MVNGILLLYRHGISANASTIMEHVNSFAGYSRYKTWKINTTFGFPTGLDKINFKVIVLHYSLFGSYPFGLNQKFISYIKNSSQTYKIAFFQDEHQNCNYRFNILRELNVDCIYSLLEQKYAFQVYSENAQINCIRHTLTGYVENTLIEKAALLRKPFHLREIDIGYRARPLPYWMGRGAQEKTMIATEFLARAINLGLALDIKTGESDRIYGEAWYEFIANCKFMLGVEAGVSVFDINNEVRPKVEAILKKTPNISFEEMYELVLKDHEDLIYYRTISPRVFEAAAFKVCQILFEGEYQGILKPMIHYIPLKKDFSNFNEVCRVMQDKETIDKMVERAYEDLIASGKFGYGKFIEDFDAHLALSNPSLFSNDYKDDYIDGILNRNVKLKIAALRLKSIVHSNWPGKATIRKFLSRLKSS